MEVSPCLRSRSVQLEKEFKLRHLKARIGKRPTLQEIQSHNIMHEGPGGSIQAKRDELSKRMRADALNKVRFCVNLCFKMFSFAEVYFFLFSSGIGSASELGDSSRPSHRTVMPTSELFTSVPFNQSSFSFKIPLLQQLPTFRHLSCPLASSSRTPFRSIHSFIHVSSHLEMT
jgi:hypothetical protein